MSIVTGLFTNLGVTGALVSVVACLLICLGIIELFNLLVRARLQETWGFSLISALAEIGVAFALLFTADQNAVWHLALIAGYVIARGVLEILIGLRAVDDRTDKFIWTLVGICGVIMGFVILNSGSVAVEENAPAFIKAFGAYMSIYGIASLIYGVHNHDQAEDLKEERKEAAKRGAKKLAKLATSSKKTTKKPAAKKTAKKTTKKAKKSTK